MALTISGPQWEFDNMIGLARNPHPNPPPEYQGRGSEWDATALPLILAARFVSFQGKDIHERSQWD